MEKLLEKYVGVPQKQRFLLVGLLAAGLLYGFYALYYEPTAASLESAHEEYGKVEAERAEKQAYVDNLARYEARLNELQQDLNVARAQLPDSADVAQLLAQLGNKGRQSGLVIDSFEPKAEAVRDFVGEIPFAVKVRGSYHEIGTFVDAVGKLDRIITVTGISLAAPKTENQKVVVDSSFVLKTYRFVQEQAGK